MPLCPYALVGYVLTMLMLILVFSGRVIFFRQSVSSIFRHIESKENFEGKKKKMQPANVSAPPSPPAEFIPWTNAVS